MDKNSLKFITEIASTHNGNFKILEQIFKKHIKSKSDLIKIQIINAQNIYPKTSQKYLRFKTLEIQKKILNSIIFEDEGLIAINKPPGIVVHGGSKQSYGVIEIFRALNDD